MNQIQLLEQLGKRLASATDEAEYNAILGEMQKLSPEALNDIQRVVLRSQAVSGVNAENFFSFYHLMYGFALPKHMKRAVKKAFEAHERGLPFVLLGARGFWKTVTFVTLDAFLIGHNPHMTGIITGANDQNCINIAKNIANLIEHNPEWKLTFPHVVPKDKAWGADGYWVMDNRMSRDEWEQRQAGIIDPTFVGGGYKSSAINGKHPSLFLHADDLHDIDSWKSETERTTIKNTFLTQILKTAIRENDKFLTWVNLLGVPFAKDDTLNTVIETGQCVAVTIPVMSRAPEGEGVYIDGVNKANGAVYEDIIGWWKLTWADHYGVESVIADRSYGKFGFWQMYMMDIDTAKTAGIKYYLYSHEKLDNTLPMVGGADPTTFQKNTGKGQSSFALCQLAKLPNNTAVVVDVFLKQCSLTEAKDAILLAQSKYPNWRYTGIESVSVGKVFYEYLLTDPRIRAIKSDLTGLKSGNMRSKPDRQKIEVSGWLENMTVLISDADTPGLRALRKLYDNFPDVPEHDEAWDAGDALYHALKLVPEVLRLPMSDNELNTPSKQALLRPYNLQSAWSNA